MIEGGSKIGVFVHIEKTAGTSVRDTIENAVGKNEVYVYHPKTDRLSRSSEGLHPTTSPIVDKTVAAFSNPLLAPVFSRLFPLAARMYDIRIRRAVPKLEVPEDAKVIFGHFPADKFDNKIKDPLYAVVLREPMERMRSQYDHWRRMGGALDWRVTIPFDPKMPFTEFAMLAELQNYQAQALAGKHVTDFDVVGTTHDVDGFTSRLLVAFSNEGICPPEQATEFQVKHLNATKPKRQTPVPQGNDTFRRAFRNFHEHDYEIYNEALHLTS